MKRSIIALPVFAVAVAVGAACRGSKQPPVVAEPSVADSADQVLFGVQYVLTSHGIKRGDLHADTAYVLQDQTRFDLRKAHVVFTTENGAPQGTMDGDRGVYSTRSQVLEGWGNVVVRFVDGRMLKSPHVVYNEVQHTISSDTSYTIVRGKDTQYGTGFTSNQTFTSFKCLHNCGGNFAVLLPEK